MLLLTVRLETINFNVDRNQWITPREMAAQGEWRVINIKLPFFVNTGCTTRCNTVALQYSAGSILKRSSLWKELAVTAYN